MKKAVLSTILGITLLFQAAPAVFAEAETDEAASIENSIEPGQSDREVLYQVSLLQGLTFGDYNGSIPVKELKERGDTGLGTFDGLNGELIMLDGVVYRALGDGSVEVVADEELIPFADVTFFDADETEELSSVASIDDLKSLLNEYVEKTSSNRFYVIRIDGTFSKMNVRSELKQEKPYKPLAKVLETDQTFFDYEDIKGTVVGLYCPDYMSDLNAAGWHLHFISEDGSKGGHILDLAVDQAVLSIDETLSFQMALPVGEMFDSFDLTVDQSEDIKKVEQGESDS